MKPRNLFQVMGFRGKAKHYGFDVHKLNVSNFGEIEFAKWQHPNFSNWIGSIENLEFTLSEDLGNLRKLIKPGDFCIDIGAHSGWSSLAPAISTGLDGLVLALEPNPYIFPVLEKNVDLNKHYTNICALNLAATVNDGLIEFAYSDSGFCNGGFHQDISFLRHGHAFKLNVEGINLQNLLYQDFYDRLPRLKLIKIDAEGYDLSILRSLEEILCEFSPFLKIEMFKYSSKNYRKALVNFLEHANYKVDRLKNNRFEIIGPLKKGDFKSGENFDVLASPLH